MTTIAFFTAADGTITGFEAKGHTGYARSGEDIVCAAVSALTQSVLYGMREVIKAPVMFEQRNNGAMLTVMFRPEADAEAIEKGQILFETLKGSLQAIAGDYPRYVRIIFTERR